MLYIFDKNEQLQCVLEPDGQSSAAQTPNRGPCPYHTSNHDDKLNQDQTLTFTIPADHPDAQNVIEGSLVAFLDLDANYQLFEITLVEDGHTDVLTKQVTAEQAYVELLDEYIETLTVTDVDAETALGDVLSGTRWSVGTVTVAGTASQTFTQQNVVAAIQSIISTWGGELRFRVDIVGTTITGRYVDLFAQRGSVTGKRFVYGKDLVEVHRTIDLTNLKTALYGIGQTDSSGTALTFADVVWSTANGDPVDKPSGQTWVGDPTALTNWGRANGTRHRKGSFTDANCSDATTLLQETWAKLETLTTPALTYQMKVVDLERIAGYDHEAVRLGDTVSVIDDDFEPALQLQARVIEIKRDLTQYENTTVTLGNFLPRITDDAHTLANLTSSVNQGSGYWDNKLSPGDSIDTSWLTGVIDVLKTQLQDNSGYVYDTGDGDGILILDKPKDQNPTRAMKLGGGMLAIANSKDATTGDWAWSTFGTGDGFAGELLLAESVTGDKVAARTLTALKMTIGDFTNLCQINETSNTDGYATSTDPTSQQVYFQIGTGQWVQLMLAESTTVDFKVGDSYYFAFYGYASASTYSLGAFIRYNYTDGSWADAGSAGISIDTSSGVYRDTAVTIANAPDPTKTIETVGFFLQKNSSDDAYAYVRNIELRHMTGTALIQDAAITSAKIKSLTWDQAQGGTAIIGGASNGNGEFEVQDSNGNKIGSIDNQGFKIFDSSGNLLWWTVPISISGKPTVGTSEAYGALYAISTTDFGKASGQYYFGASTADNQWVFVVTPNSEVYTHYTTLDDGTGKLLTGGMIQIAGGTPVGTRATPWLTFPVYNAVCFDQYGNLMPQQPGNIGSTPSWNVFDKNGAQVLSVDIGGDKIVHMTGLAVSGTKSAKVQTSQGDTYLYAVEGPENRFEDVGESRTDGTGTAVVMLDKVYLETVDTSNRHYIVHVDGIEEDGFYVPQRLQDRFTVKGPANTGFMYTVKAWRKGYVGQRFNQALQQEV